MSYWKILRLKFNWFFFNLKGLINTQSNLINFSSYNMVSFYLLRVVKAICMKLVLHVMCISLMNSDSNTKVPGQRYDLGYDIFLLLSVVIEYLFIPFIFKFFCHMTNREIEWLVRMGREHTRDTITLTLRKVVGMG